MPYAVILETDRLFLRRLTPDDAPLICDLDSDPEVMRYISKGQPTPLEKIENEVLTRWLRIYEKHEHLGFFAAHEKASGDFIGWLCLQPDRYIPEIEIGYRLKRHVWGRGYATEGSKALVEKAFTALAVISAMCSASGPAAANRPGANGRTDAGIWPVAISVLTAQAVSGPSKMPLR